MIHRLPLLLIATLAACVQPPAPDELYMPTVESAPGSTLHSFTIDRAYTLTDTRELAFRDQIAAEARQLCGLGEYSLYSSRPVGVEVVREDFLYRQHEVQITCDR
ncbi:hypothetical protein [Pseudotabrizicola alkalilacus]|uniref:Lipoprotein n=1 Tax=Pseudotabrizicola alkalilacus TaxID=2305252 RepID=A0A411YXK5_9RHOB|nr:hypothetical protein [Pseudotabrizicola alkalilacus]RGP35624.1 hypothetical protein D1012_18725 [Pseudotabrizicola alkalilacus]